VRLAFHLRIAVQCETLLARCLPCHYEGIVRVTLLAKLLHQAIADERAYNGETHTYPNIPASRVTELLQAQTT
jgi:hypothetical protein